MSMKLKLLLPIESQDLQHRIYKIGMSHQQTSRGNQSYDGIVVRDQLSHFFLSEAGKVPWQNTYIKPTNFN